MRTVWGLFDRRAITTPATQLVGILHKLCVDAHRMTSALVSSDASRGFSKRPILSLCFSPLCRCFFVDLWEGAGGRTGGGGWGGGIGMGRVTGQGVWW